MATDPFDDLLELENDYYKEGYDAGVADSTYAGMIEGKVFGIEKGYEKGLELGKLHGRALVWRRRLSLLSETDALGSQQGSEFGASSSTKSIEQSKLSQIVPSLGKLPDNTRIRRHVDALHSASDGQTVACDNSDGAVTEFDDRIAKAKAKAKVVANIAGESLNPAPAANAGIEDATGLQARH